MDNSESRLNLLLDVLSDRKINLRRDDIAWAFHSAQTKDSIAKYVDEYLTPDSLLSHEELQMHNRNKVRVGSTQIEASTAIQDLDFDLALQSLEQSTLAIDKQCAALEAQKAALSSLLALTNPSPQEPVLRPSVSRSGSQFHSRAAAEVKGRITDVSLLLDQEWRRTKEAVRMASNTTKYQLDLDDQILDRLQSSMKNTKPTDTGDRTIVELESLCTKLTSLRSKALKNEVNQIYRQALAEGATLTEEDVESESASAGALSSLSMELDTLMGGLDSVLQMVVEHEHRRAILSELRAASQDANDSRLRQDEHTVGLLAHLTERLVLLSEFVKDGHEQSTAFHTIDLVIQQIGASIIDKAAGISQSMTLACRQDSPTRTQPFKDILRQLDIRLPGRPDIMNIDHALRSALNENTRGNDRLSQSTEDSQIEQLEKTLSAADKDLRHLTEAMFAHTSFKTPQLSSPMSKEQLGSVDHRANVIGKEMAELDHSDIARLVKPRLAELLLDS